MYFCLGLKELGAIYILAIYILASSGPIICKFSSAIFMYSFYSKFLYNVMSSFESAKSQNPNLPCIEPCLHTEENFFLNPSADHVQISIHIFHLQFLFAVFKYCNVFF